MSSERTEKPTPKRRRDARRKGQVARSTDLNGAVVLIAALGGLSAFGPAVVERAGEQMSGLLARAGDPSVVTRSGIGGLLLEAAAATALAVGPLALACLCAGVCANVVQVGLSPAPEAIKPDPKRLNPVTNAKNIFGLNALVEAVKSTGKVAVVGAIAAAVLVPNLTAIAGLVGIPPAALGGELTRRVATICWLASLAYLGVAAADVFWQRRRHEKQLRMRKDEVKREQREESISPELRATLRRRQSEMSRSRMMAAVLGADVVVTNPTHFAVALSYDGSRPAPVVVAKGQDLVALAIRRVARENGVPVVENPPLARSLFDSVELNAEIPESMYRAIAELLAFVYRTAGRASERKRRAAA